MRKTFLFFGSFDLPIWFGEEVKMKIKTTFTFRMLDVNQFQLATHARKFFFLSFNKNKRSNSIININWHWITAFNGLVYIAAAIRLSNFDHFHNFMLKSISLSMACAKYAHLMVFECTRPKTVVFSWAIAFQIVCIWPQLASERVFNKFRSIRFALSCTQLQ